MSWSLNEVEVLAKKAARGAGYSWGMAEETGKAVRGLAEQGIDATGYLAALLERFDGVNHREIAPVENDRGWSAPGGGLCPLVAGAALSDRGPEIGSGFRLERVSYPVFVIPFAIAVARRTGQRVLVEWPGITVFVDGEDVRIGGDDGDLSVPDALFVEVKVADGPVGRLLARSDRSFMSGESAAALSAFAQRTYAPATEASRLAGAGAGLSDND